MVEKSEPKDKDEAHSSASAGGRRKLGVSRPTADAPLRTDRRGVRTRFKPEGLKPPRRAPAESSGEESAKAGLASDGDRRSQTRVEGGAPAERGARSKRSAGTERSTRSERDRRPSPSVPGAGRVRSEGVRRAQSDSERGARNQDPRRASTERGSPDVTPRTNQAEGVRLSKVMAERGLCSRREADAIIERGWVFVNGTRVCELGIRIDPAADIELAPEAEKRQAQQVTMLLHKPVGYVSGQPEPGYEPAVALIGADNQFDRDTAAPFHPSQLRGLAPAGRLDIDSTGLLVLTQNGRIARQLIGDDSKVEKEYIVRVEGGLDDRDLARLNHGLELDGRKLRPAKVEWLNDDQLRFVLREGRKRQIRRMCELVGLRVVGLKRVRIGNVRLGDLPLGHWRLLRPDERF
ncbi:pseudouridine synthase [Rhodocyclaceae bacterium SMB388]